MIGKYPSYHYFFTVKTLMGVQNWSRDGGGKREEENNGITPFLD